VDDSVCEFVYTGSDFWSFTGGRGVYILGLGSAVVMCLVPSLTNTKSVHFSSDILEAFHGDEQTHRPIEQTHGPKGQTHRPIEQTHFNFKNSKLLHFLSISVPSSQNLARPLCNIIHYNPRIGTDGHHDQTLDIVMWQP
jgi:hypothetical protein